MDINAAKLVYFSPTGTTKKILEGITEGIQVQTTEHLDMTPPESRTREIGEMQGELALIGAPVYGGRLPFDAVQRLRRLRSNDTPAVVVVVYGNREYEDALLELSDLVTEGGFIPVAGGAFIGEHSFDSETLPIASGRPDGQDLARAAEFGKAIREKMRGIGALDEIPPLEVPGDFPYKEWSKWPDVSPITQETTCIKCEACVAACPTAAITMNETVFTDTDACIVCCACVRACPTGARVTEHPRIRQSQEWLNTNCRQRKEPETFL
ncbi:MAG: 4Fe-4S binding protein [Anaerolineae bacterium]|nr:4Fe-4S binding protein [Anaerolineae bacterium]